MKKKDIVIKKTLDLNEIENIRKSYRALNMIVNIRKNTGNITDLRESALDELDKICTSNNECCPTLLKRTIVFDESKHKFVLNWK